MRAIHPDWHNAPVPSWGDAGGWLAVVGLAPGEKGANRSGRPFTGDAAGDLLLATLAEFDLSQRSGCGWELNNMLLTNAVRCLPPANKPTVSEIHACRPFLVSALRAMPGLRVVLALGQVAHQSAVKALGGKLPKHRFAHNEVHRLHTGIVLVDSYHPSRYNQNVGRLTPDMLRTAVATAVAMRA